MARASSASRPQYLLYVTRLTRRAKPALATLATLFTGEFGLDFLYYEPPRVRGILPTGGPLGGGTLVTVVGFGFDGLGRVLSLKS